MLSTYDYIYFQPLRYSDDGTNIDYGNMPEELHSFDAFRTESDCREWLENNGYEPGDFVIVQYKNDDIEDVRLLDYAGYVVMPIDEVPVDGIVNMLGDEVIWNEGSMDNLRTPKYEYETDEDYKDRIHKEALDLVHDAIFSIEMSNDYNFAAYWGKPDIDWLDKARDEVVQDVMKWMMEED